MSELTNKHERQHRLPPIKRSIRDCCSQDQHPGYSRKPRSRIKLRTQALQSEQELLFDLKNLDDVLSKNMLLIDGLLFSTEVTHRLTQAIVQELRRNKGAFDQECFGKVLQNPQQPNPETESRPSIYRKIRTLGKHNQQSYYETKAFTNIKNASEQSTPLNANKGFTLESSSIGNIFNSAELERYIRKQERVVAVWLPPVSYPQFFGFVVYGKVKLINANQRVIVIERMYLPRYLNPTKMFTPLLEFLCRYCKQPLNILQIKTSKQNYHCRFKRWGWRLKSILEHQYRLWYDPDSQEPSPY